MNGEIQAGGNALMDFYRGVQEGRQIREQKQRQEQFYQMLQQQMQAGQVRPEAKMATTGEMSYSFPFVEQEQPYQIQQDVQVPEGYQITEYDYKGQPKIKRIEEKEEKIKEPTWKQQATVNAIKADLKRGSGTTYSLMGEPQPFEMKTEEDALNYISQRGYSPELFKEELAKFRKPTGVQGDRITVQDAQGNSFSLPREQLGEAIKQGYRQIQ